MTGLAGAHFVFEVSEDDDRIYRKLNMKDLRRYLDRRILKGIPMAVFLCLLAALLVAFTYDLLPLSALLCAEGTFAVAYMAALLAGSVALSRFGNAMFREIPPASRHYDCAFDEDGIVVKSGLRESRMPWSEIRQVEATPSMVIFRYQPGLGFFLPQRVFDTDAARAAFATWAAARVRAAAQPSAAIGA
jgi:YcxB-like protein